MSIWKWGVICFAAWAAFACSDDGSDDDNNTSDPDETDNGDAGDETDSDTDSETETEDDFVPDPEANVCNFTEAVTLGEPDEDGMVLVPPNHPEIQYFGRVDCADPSAPAFGYPGVSIRAKFEGDAVDMVMDDSGNGDKINYYNVIIDDGEPTVLEMIPGENTYSLASELEDTEHTVEIYKRVESNYGAGRGVFLGFRIPEGRDLLDLSPRPFRLEVIGDSISCGYGNEISTDNPNDYHYTTTNSNAYNAWAAIAARDLDAEYMAVAYSGRGVVRNYDGGSAKTLPDMYLNSIPDGSSSTEWDIHQFTPDVLTINLGTNDFSVGLEVEEVAAFREEFELGLLEFVETLRRYYPHAAIILAEGPMLSDGYPAGLRALTSVRDAMEAVVAARAADGDENVYYLDLGTQSSPYGEDWHPTVETHQRMAETLMGLIDELDLM